jgi:hypothetical protein
LIVLDLTNKKNAAVVEASYLVAQRIAKIKKPHTIAEELILPCAKDIVSVMMGSDCQMTQLGEEFKIWHMVFYHK